MSNSNKGDRVSGPIPEGTSPIDTSNGRIVQAIMSLGGWVRDDGKPSMTTKQISELLAALSVERDALLAERDAALAEVLRQNSTIAGMNSMHAKLAEDFQATKAERDRLAAEAERMREALESAARQFARYADQHRAEGTPDGNAKALTNEQWADRCVAGSRAALGTGGAP